MVCYGDVGWCVVVWCLNGMLWCGVVDGVLFCLNGVLWCLNVCCDVVDGVLWCLNGVLWCLNGVLWCGGLCVVVWWMV
jgi:hypothetical protein